MPKQAPSETGVGESLAAGVFKAWVLVAARLYAVPLRVPRTFYVNSIRAPTDGGSPAQTLGGLKVQRTLPFGREPFHLYQVSLEEDKMQM